jgi:hypothetical protein
VAATHDPAQAEPDDGAMDGSGDDLGTVARRVIEDREFADAVRNDPVQTLRAFELDAAGLRVIERLVAETPGAGTGPTWVIS